MQKMAFQKVSISKLIYLLWQSHSTLTSQLESSALINYTVQLNTKERILFLRIFVTFFKAVTSGLVPSNIMPNARNFALRPKILQALCCNHVDSDPQRPMGCYQKKSLLRFCSDHMATVSLTTVIATFPTTVTYKFHSYRLVNIYKIIKIHFCTVSGCRNDYIDRRQVLIHDLGKLTYLQPIQRYQMCNASLYFERRS